LRVKTGVNDIKELFDDLSPDSRQNLCDRPVPVVDKAPRVPGAGRGRPRKISTTAGLLNSLSSPLEMAQRGPISVHLTRLHPSPSPLREFQEDTSQYTLNELSAMSGSDSDFFSDGRTMGFDGGEMSRPEDVLEEGEQEDHDEGMELSDEGEEEAMVEHDDD
jgi:hypothetical protein